MDCSSDAVQLAVLSLEIALRRLPRTEAQEVAQGAIAAYLKHQEHVDAPAAYVTRVTYNLILELYEHRRRYRPVGDLPDVPDAAAEEASSRVLDRLLAKVFIEEEVDTVLTPRERETLMLAYEVGLSREDVARRLGVKPETVKDTLRRAKRKVRRSAELDSLRGLTDD